MRFDSFFLFSENLFDGIKLRTPREHGSVEWCLECCAQQYQQPFVVFALFAQSERWQKSEFTGYMGICFYSGRFLCFFVCTHAYRMYIVPNIGSNKNTTVRTIKLPKSHICVIAVRCVFRFILFYFFFFFHLFFFSFSCSFRFVSFILILIFAIESLSNSALLVERQASHK